MSNIIVGLIGEEGPVNVFLVCLYFGAKEIEQGMCDKARQGKTK